MGIIEGAARFYKHLRGEPKTIMVIPTGFVNSGGEGVKGFVDVIVDGTGRRMRMFMKQLSEECQNFPEACPEETMAKYWWLRHNGFPVLPTFRYDPDSFSYLMTDATAGGHLAVVDSNNPIGCLGMKVHNVRSIMQETVAVAKAAYDSGNGVLLDSDSYAMLVDRRGVHLSILDITTNSYLIRNGKSHTTGMHYSVRDAIDFAQCFNQKVLKHR